MKRFFMVFLIVLGLVMLVAAIIIASYANYRIDQDIDGWKDRAQVSSEPNDMLLWMTKVKEGLEEWGMTSGYANLLFHTPENDMALIYKTVINHVNQAGVLTKMDRSSPQYQMGLDNLRGSIRELDIHTHNYWDVHDGLLVNVMGVLGAIIFVIGAVWAFIDWANNN